MTEKINVVESTPRGCKIQIHRDNTLASSPSEYYKCVLAIPFHDHMQLEIKGRFSTVNCIIMNCMSFLVYLLVAKIGFEVNH